MTADRCPPCPEPASCYCNGALALQGELEEKYAAREREPVAVVRLGPAALTPPQQRVLCALHQYQRLGFPPTVRELAALAGYSQSSLAHSCNGGIYSPLRQLVEQGYVLRQPSRDGAKYICRRYRVNYGRGLAFTVEGGRVTGVFEVGA